MKTTLVSRRDLGPPLRAASRASAPLSTRLVSRRRRFSIFTEVASELPFTTGDKKVQAAYSSSYAKDPIAEALGVKNVPALLLMKPGAEPSSMTIPRDRKLFTEELVTEWLQAQLKD